MRAIRKWFFFIAVSTFVGAMPCFAVLGGDISSVQADQLRMQARLQVTATAGYTVHELQSPTGVVVREFASGSGKVFAVAWQGPWQPDLKDLLGAHFAEFQKALQSQKQGRSGHGPIVVQLPGLVVELRGHMRDFSGRAYLPDQLPEGVRAEEIR